MSLYKTIERTFFNSLSKKITGNVVFLLLPHLFLLLVGGYLASGLHAQIQALGLSETQKGSLTEGLNHLVVTAGATAFFAICAGVFTIFFMRHLFLKPIREMTRVLKAIKEKDGDISATLPAYTYDEISEMARSYNEFTDRLRHMIAETRRHSVNVALSATHVQKVILESSKSAFTQEQNAQQVFQSSSQSSQAIDEISSSAVVISDQTSSNMAEIRASNAELNKVLDQIRMIRDLATRFQETVHKLSLNSADITRILSMVQDFSDQTNLLALNASIEAARAGDAGRGFSVVADEVRNLSQKVSEATGQIDINISEMSQLVDSTRSSAGTILEYVQNTEVFIDTTSVQFHKLVADFEEINSQLTGISSAIDELSYTNRESHQNVALITDLAESMKKGMEQSLVHSADLELATEKTQELLSHFAIGMGGFEDMTRTGMGWAQEVSNELVKLQAKGINVFDTHYRRTNPGQTPEKFDTAYVDAYERSMQPIFDGFIRARPEFIYAIAVDKNGYAPAHHSKVSKALTGDVSVDLLQSRHRRMFAGNRAEKRRCSHKNPFLLQTFIRDTGEVLNDLSIPLYVDGKHWGALIMGFDPKCLLTE